MYTVDEVLAFPRAGVLSVPDPNAPLSQITVVEYAARYYPSIVQQLRGNYVFWYEFVYRANYTPSEFIVAADLAREIPESGIYESPSAPIAELPATDDSRPSTGISKTAIVLIVLGLLFLSRKAL
jgi:hypothetical protein